MDLTKTDIRILSRVATIKVTPWTGAVSATGKNGGTIKVSKAAFKRLEEGGFIIRSQSSLISDTYIVHEAALHAMERAGDA